MESNFDALSEDFLTNLIVEMIDIDEIPNALSELYKKNSIKAFHLSRNIIENELGDAYLQAAIIDIVFNYNKNYILKFIENNIQKLNYYIYGAVLNNFAIESKQKFGESLDRKFLMNLKKKYEEYDSVEKVKINEQYEWFIDSYSARLL